MPSFFAPFDADTLRFPAAALGYDRSRKDVIQ